MNNGAATLWSLVEAEIEELLSDVGHVELVERKPVGIPVWLHWRIAVAAEAHGVSVEDVVVSTLEKAFVVGVPASIETAPAEGLSNAVRSFLKTRKVAK